MIASLSASLIDVINSSCYNPTYLSPPAAGTLGSAHPSLWTAAWWRDALALTAIITSSPPSYASDLCEDVSKHEYPWWSTILETSNDDQLWWSHAWLLCYKLNPSGATSRHYLDKSMLLVDHVVETGYNTELCGGGVLWDSGIDDYKNAIANSLLIRSATELFSATMEEKYRDIADDVTGWFMRSGMLTDSFGVVDGLDASCVANGLEWTYNDGMVIEAFYKHGQNTNNNTLLDIAERVAERAVDRFTVEGAEGGEVLAEDCCVTPTDCACNQDGIMFKGVLAKSLSLLGSHDEFLLGQMNAMSKHKDADTGRYGIAWNYDAKESIDGRELDDVCTAQIAALMAVAAGETAEVSAAT
jgi:hypothetical protein